MYWRDKVLFAYKSMGSKIIIDNLDGRITQLNLKQFFCVIRLHSL